MAFVVLVELLLAPQYHFISKRANTVAVLKGYCKGYVGQGIST